MNATGSEAASAQIRSSGRVDLISDSPNLVFDGNAGIYGWMPGIYR
jgi:hypothetical protein